MNEINVTFTKSGAGYTTAPKTAAAGMQFDENNAKLTFIRPLELEDADLVLRINSTNNINAATGGINTASTNIQGMTKYEPVILGQENEFILPKSITQELRIKIQPVFVIEEQQINTTPIILTLEPSISIGHIPVVRPRGGISGGVEIASNDRFLVNQQSEKEQITKIGAWSYQIGRASEHGRFFISPEQFPDLATVDGVTGIIGHYATTIGSKIVLYYQDNQSFDVLKVFDVNAQGEINFEETITQTELENITRCLLNGAEVWLARFNAADELTGIAETFLFNVNAPSQITYTREVEYGGLRTKLDIFNEANGSITLTDKNGNIVRTVLTGAQYSDIAYLQAQIDELKALMP